MIEECCFFAIFEFLFTIDPMRRKRPLHNNTLMPLISLYRVSRFYRNDRSALFDVSFNVFAGEFVYITGTSGAGKSTLIKLLGALDMPDTGSICFNGHDLSNLKQTAVALLRRSMGVVFQDFRLVPDMTVAANVSIPLEVSGWSLGRIRTRVAESLEKVRLADIASERAGDLSGGEQQRVAIARAIAPSPEVILADEPTGNLDAYNANFVLDLFEMVRKDGATVVLATHDRMLMSARPHRIITLDKGRITGMTPDASVQSRNAKTPTMRSTG
jgi:cell division transport system ATP-binding protein